MVYLASNFAIFYGLSVLQSIAKTCFDCRLRERVALDYIQVVLYDTMELV